MTKTYKGLMLLGILLIGLGGYFIAVALASKSWDQIEGEIMNTRIPASLSNAGSTAQRHLEYRIEVTYKYDVDGRPYTNSRFSMGTGNTVEGGFNEKTKARDWLQNSDFSTGKKVIVYVKPDDPETSILSTGINIGTIAPILIGLLFFITGYVLNSKMPTLVKHE